MCKPFYLPKNLYRLSLSSFHDICTVLSDPKPLVALLSLCNCAASKISFEFMPLNFVVPCLSSNCRIL